LPGSSNFFAGGIIVYSEESKRILGVSGETIKRFGLISPYVAKEMAEKVRQLFKTDLSISTTGNIGPDALENKEVGLIYTAVSDKNGTYVKESRLKGERLKNKEEASYLALKHLLEKF
jgi:PncC family amidohydrolase